MTNAALQRMQVFGGAQAFNRRYPITLVHDSQRQTGVNSPAVDDHGAGPALAMIAAFLGAGQMQMIPQGIEERRSGVDLHALHRPVHLQTDPSGGRSRAQVWGAGQVGTAETASVAAVPVRMNSRRLSLSSSLGSMESSFPSGQLPTSNLDLDSWSIESSRHARPVFKFRGEAEACVGESRVKN